MTLKTSGINGRLFLNVINTHAVMLPLSKSEGGTKTINGYLKRLESSRDPETTS